MGSPATSSGSTATGSAASGRPPLPPLRYTGSGYGGREGPGFGPLGSRESQLGPGGMFLASLAPRRAGGAGGKGQTQQATVNKPAPTAAPVYENTGAAKPWALK